jgi:hypothetical protein
MGGGRPGGVDTISGTSIVRGGGTNTDDKIGDDRGVCRAACSSSDTLSVDEDAVSAGEMSRVAGKGMIDSESVDEGSGSGSGAMST